MAELELRLLGPFEVTRAGERLEGFDSDKVRALLAYLAVEADRPHRREKLAGLLWPDYPERSARTSLRRALTNLRQVIGDRFADPPFLLATRQTIQFNLESDYDLDTWKFLERVGFNASTSSDFEKLETAINRYQGDFLDGFSVPDSIPFEEWVVITRESLHRKALRALHQLSAFHQGIGNYDQALAYAQRQVILEPYKEDAHQQMIWILALTGQRNLAMQHYENFKKKLEDELGVRPLTETQEMYSLMVAGELPGSPQTASVLRREPRKVGDCPYRGLAPFRESDSPFFFGREEYVQHLFDFIKSGSSVVFVVGPSGSGKSSLVFSGLVPQLRQQANWMMIAFRPGRQPFNRLAGAFIQQLEGGLSETERLKENNKLAEALASGAITLVDMVEDLMAKNSRKRLLLVVDQFEELFSLCRDRELQERFLDELLSPSENITDQVVPNLVILFTLRADFMNQALSYRPLADAIQENIQILGPMNRNELQEAVEKPAVKQGSTFEPGLVTRIIQDVGTEPGNLPLLEFSLTLLWEQLDQGWATHAAYENIGRVEGALARYAEEVFSELPIHEQEAARRLFVQLIQPGHGTEDTRRVSTTSELGETFHNLIRYLADKRLLVTGGDESGQRTVEVIHEALIRGWKRLGDWMDADREFRLWQEDLRVAIRLWNASDRDDSALLRGRTLVQAESWMFEPGLDLSRAEKDFIHRSIDLRQRDQVRRDRRRRRTIMGLAVGLVAALGMALFAGQQWRRAETQARNSTARELARAAIANLQIDPELSTLLSLEAVNQTYQVDHSVILEAEEALHRAVQEIRVLQKFEGEGTPFFFVAFNQDGTRLVTWSMEVFPGSIHVLNPVSNEILFTLSNQIPLALIQDRSQLVSVGLDFEAFEENYTIWDLTTGEEIYGFSLPFPAGEPVWNTIDGEFKQILRSLSNGIVEIWDVENPSEPMTIGSEGHPPDTSAVFSPSGKILATGNTDGSIRVWELGTGSELWSQYGHSGIVNKLATSPDGKWLVSAGGDGIGKIWEIESGNLVSTLVGHSNELLDVVFNRDATRAATTGWDRTIKVWDLKASIETGIGVELMSLTGHSARIESIDFNRDSSMLASASSDGSVRLWDIRPDGTGEGGVFINGPGQGTEGFVDSDLSPDGTLFAVANSDLTPRIWNVVTGDLFTTLSGHQDRVERIKFNPKGHYIVTTSNDNTIRGWDISSGDQVFVLSNQRCGWESGSGDFCDVAFSPDGNLLAVTDREGNLQVFEFLQLLNGSALDAVQPLYTVKIHDDFIVDVAFSPDGTQISTTSGDGTAKVISSGDGGLLFVLSGHEDYVYGISYNPDGVEILTTSADGTVRVWDSVSGELKRTLSGHASSVINAVFSPDGKLVASASYDGTTKLWDASSWSERLTLYGHNDGVGDVIFSQDGKRLFTTGGDGTSRIYLLDLDELMNLAETRLTRTFSETECQKYLQMENCLIVDE